MTGHIVLICHLRPARLRARALAISEVLGVLHGLDARELRDAPLSERRGVFAVDIPESALDQALSRFHRMGYVSAVDVLKPAPPNSAPERGGLVRWRGRDYMAERLYEEDPGNARESAPDRRPFVVRVGGLLREVKGYRGDGEPLSRRGLPAYDAAMLANLAGAGANGVLLDPFAGIGGILIAAERAGATAVSCDADPWVSDGLAHMSCGRHVVADCRALPFLNDTVDGIATEPPFAPEADGAVAESLPEMRRVLKVSGRLALMCSDRQADALSSAAARAGLRTVLRSRLDRKGTECAVFVWEKA